MITVLYFANLRETVQKESDQLELAGKTIGHLKRMIEDTYQVQGMDTVLTAVNEEYANDQTILANGDIVAFIPPVSGG